MCLVGWNLLSQGFMCWVPVYWVGFDELVLLGDLFVWVYWEAYWVVFHGCNSLIGVCLGGLLAMRG